MKISEDELRALTDAEIRASVAYLGGKLSEQRRKAEYYYLGQAKGDLAAPSIDGRSSVVDTSVRNVIEWMLPSLLKIFTAGDKAVEFAPKSPQWEQAAKQATDYINYIFYSKNPGFQLLYTWFKDALIQKVGILKIWWDNSEEDVREEYKNQDPLQVQMLLQDEGVELLESDQNDDGTLNVAVRRVIGNGRIRIEAVPPEEFLISRKAKCIEDSPFVAHRVEKTISDLRAAGYKNVDSLSGDDSAAGSMNAERIERRAFDDDTPYMPLGSDSTIDPSQRIVWLTECYLRIDYDNDGIAEWRKVVRAGNQILENVEVDGPPFVSVTPVPLPHRFFGLSMADLAMPAQLTKTSLKRAALDNLYIGVNGRYFAVENQVNLDDLVVSRPGGVVRVKSPGAVGRLDAGTGDIGGALSMLEAEEVDKENGTGFTRYSQGADSGSLNKTATGINIVTNRADARVELIARVFAETGVKDAFRMILKLVTQHQDKPDVMRLTGNWVPVDPREWKTQFDFIVNVGLGTGNKDQVVQHLMMLQQVQTQGLQLGYATKDNLFHGASKLAENLGFKDAEKFFTNPQQIPPQPPQPPPEIVKTQMQIQADAQKHQAETQADIQKTQAQWQYDEKQAGMQAQLDKYKVDVDAQTKLAVEQIRVEAMKEMEQYKAQVGMAMEQHRDQKAIADMQPDDSVVRLGDQFTQSSQAILQAIQALMQGHQGLADAVVQSIELQKRPRKAVKGPDGAWTAQIQ